MAKKCKDSIKEIKKFRREYLLACCAKDEHQWQAAAAAGYEVCPVCHAIRRPDAPGQPVKPDAPGQTQASELTQCTLWE